MATISEEEQIHVGQDKGVSLKKEKAPKPNNLMDKLGARDKVIFKAIQSLTSQVASLAQISQHQTEEVTRDSLIINFHLHEQTPNVAPSVSSPTQKDDVNTATNAAAASTGQRAVGNEL